MLLQYAPLPRPMRFAWLPRFLLCVNVVVLSILVAETFLSLRLKTIDQENARPILIEGLPTAACLTR